MSEAGDIVRSFYVAVSKKDIPAARRYLADDLVFVGLFETYPDANAYVTALTGLLQITRRLDVKTIISEGDQAAIFFDLETGPPAPATTLVAEWHRVKLGKIVWVRSAFDGRPFEAMFTRAG